MALCYAMPQGSSLSLGSAGTGTAVGILEGNVRSGREKGGLAKEARGFSETQHATLLHAAYCANHLGSSEEGVDSEEEGRGLESTRMGASQSSEDREESLEWDSLADWAPPVDESYEEEFTETEFMGGSMPRDSGDLGEGEGHGGTYLFSTRQRSFRLH